MKLIRDEVIERARQAGERLAHEGRDRTLQRGRRLDTAHAEKLDLTAGHLAKAASGLIVGIGDSWLDYFWDDILNQLEAGGFDCRDVARGGASLAEIAFTKGGQLDRLAKLLRQLPAGAKPRAIILSGGGNDVVGDDGAVLTTLLNHRESGLPALIDSQVDAIVDVQLRSTLVTVLTQITSHCQTLLGTPIPIVLHGYGNPVPDGAYLPLPRRGPWLQPAFAEKGWTDLEENKDVMKELIERLNVMQKDTIVAAGFEHVNHVDVRPALSSGVDYKDHWVNELHPTREGFAAVSQLIAAAL